MHPIRKRLTLNLLGLALTFAGPAALAADGGIKAEIDPVFMAEIERIKSDSRLQTGFAHIIDLEPRHQAELIELTEIPAPPFKEEKRAARFAELLRETGLTDVWIDEVGNAIGRRPGTTGERVVAYSAHLDTVFPEETDVTVRFEGERMYAPGIGDNSRGLVVVLGVLRAMQHANIETEADILFIGNVGEEGLGDLRGVKHLFRDGAEPIDTLIVVDGGQSDRIVYGGVGSHRYRVTFKGPGGHSWGAFGTANPHHALSRTLAKFDQRAVQVTSEGEKSSYNVGRIGGGTSINSVPFESWAEIDIRSGDQARIDKIDAILHQAVAEALEEENEGRTEGDALTVDVARVGTRPAAKGNLGSPIVQRSVAATQSFGVEPTLRISSTDANLPISKGIPAVTMSRGGVGGDAHAPSEWWENKDGHIGMQIGLLTLVAEAGLAE
jgi:acetylornithine deacetylase/succinyl-diaminopimelate desuccinylase-like protein